MHTKYIFFKLNLILDYRKISNDFWVHSITVFYWNTDNDKDFIYEIPKQY